MSNKEYTPSAIANNILWIAKEEDVSITPMQLMKLVYFVYGWTYALTGRKLFNEPIVAWKYGPVIQSLYYQFQSFGSNPINNFAVINSRNEDGEIIDKKYPIVDPNDEDVFNVLKLVWNGYKSRDGWNLSNLTHERDSAWDKAWRQGRDTPLNDEDIKERSLKGIHRIYDSEKE